MTKIGVILCGYGTRDLIDRAISPWLSLRMNPTYDIRICAVSVRFAGFEGEDDGTRERLRWYLENGEIDHLVDSPDGMTEVAARSAALSWLMNRGITHSWQVDSDEQYEVDQIKRIVLWVETNPFIVWHRLNLRNLVFDEHTYLAEPFTPSRIHRIDSLSSCIADSFYEDNGIQYLSVVTGKLFPDREFASATVPESIAAIKHYSWINDERSRLKQAYQWRRWNYCSFAWDEHKGLVFNPALPAPKIVRES